MTFLYKAKTFFTATAFAVSMAASSAVAAGNERLENFLTVTGFDVALEINLEAEGADSFCKGRVG